ncbi:hypothetical protein OG800_48695 [Streptomyces sp. NBC_00445]|uniref:hypothetical protein n=1 Tax=Streptomyces sp. NBC_00445 TaxID=2975745 RepID=UPI002E1ED634
MALAVVRDLREFRDPVSAEELEQFETVGGIAVQSLAVGEPGHVGAGEARDRESQAQDHPASGQSGVALGVVVEDGADDDGDLTQGLELAEGVV